MKQNSLHKSVVFKGARRHNAISANRIWYLTLTQRKTLPTPEKNFAKSRLNERELVAAWRRGGPFGAEANWKRWVGTRSCRADRCSDIDPPMSLWILISRDQYLPLSELILSTRRQHHPPQAGWNNFCVLVRCRTYSCINPLACIPTSHGPKHMQGFTEGDMCGYSWPATTTAHWK